MMSTFTYDKKNFLLDGKPFRVLSGAIHYWRVVPEYWEDRLRKLKACGFNTVETYTPWNLHERREGEFDFSGNLDIVRFIETAERLGLKIIVRPGPYICSEFEFGGLPSRLLARPDITLRANDPKYLETVKPYYRELFSRIRPHLCTAGGGIIMVQIENEYGSYGDDREYLEAVAGIYRECGIDCLLYTSDGPTYTMLSGGTLPEYPAVANFGSRPEEAFRVLRDCKPDQPLMCGEFWCGWFDHWGEKHHIRAADDTAATMKKMLDMGASLNFYMFHGGTNFGFTNGANHTGKEYQPTVTSYDYCAPLSEAGDLTPAFYTVRKVLENFLGELPPLDVENTPKAAYGICTLTETAPLFENLDALGTAHFAPAPRSMEEWGQDFGFILYRSEVTGPIEENPLVLEHLHDRAHIFINGKLAGIRERTGREDPVTLRLGKGERARIEILVENLGRVNYGPKLFDRKGIFGGIRLGQRYHFGWEQISLPMENFGKVRFGKIGRSHPLPAFFRGHLHIEGQPKDTFLSLPSFSHGFAVINGFNLGRYWNERGPQKTLYVPAPVLREGDNEILIFETDGCKRPQVVFSDTPDLG